MEATTMPDLETIPRYKLSDVLAETGLKADTVRAWERRYGLPAPQRSPGGHRLYTRRDIRTLQWLVAHQREGLRISHAVARWRETIVRGIDPLSQTGSRLPSPLEAVRQAWVDACLDFDEARANRLLDAALADHPAETLCLEVLQPGLRQIGALWYQGQASVQQEHFASELAMRRLHNLLNTTDILQTGQTLLVGTPTGDRHGFAALLLATLLRLRGWRVIFLGAEVPTDRLHHTLRTTRPDAALFTAQLLTSVPTLQETISLLAEAGVPVGYGGRVFNTTPGLRAHIPAYFLGETLQTALHRAHLLPHAPIPLLPPPASLTTLQATYDGLRQMASIFVETARERMSPLGIPPAMLEMALEQAIQQWLAALALGDLNFLAAELQWVSDLLTARNMDASVLDTFWHHFAGVAQDTLGADAAPMLAYLASRTTPKLE